MQVLYISLEGEEPIVCELGQDIIDSIDSGIGYCIKFEDGKYKSLQEDGQWFDVEVKS